MSRTAILATLLAASTLTSHAFALETPKSGTGDDPNMKRVEYGSGQRTLLVGRMKRSTTISVCPGEAIVRVVFGDDTIWEGPDPKELANAPLKNNLPLWPKSVGSTNLQIITTKADGSDRIYQIASRVVGSPIIPPQPQSQPMAEGTPDAGNIKKVALSPVTPVAAPDAGDDPEETYGLVYKCSAEKRAADAVAAKARWAEVSQRRSQQVMNARLAVAKAEIRNDAANAPRKIRFTAQGSRDIAPGEIYDDGQQTGFRFPGNMQVPAIYAGRCGSKSEQIVPFNMQGDTVMAQRTSPEFCLRLGRMALNVFNLDYDPVGVNYQSGTTSPNIIRTLRQASQ